jgi:hypothetical protein
MADDRHGHGHRGEWHNQSGLAEHAKGFFTRHWRVKTYFPSITLFLAHRAFTSSKQKEGNIRFALSAPRLYGTHDVRSLHPQGATCYVQ